MTNTKICSECQKAFERKGSVQDFAERVSRLLFCEKKCACPTFSVSPHSPCPVDAAEEITACASHPHHAAMDGSVTHKVFDRAFTQGLSVTRLAFADKGMDGVISFCELIDLKKSGKQPELRSMGVVTMLAQDVRDVVFRDCRTPAFQVYDTAGDQEHLIAHADIVGCKYFGKLESLPKKDQSIRGHAQLQLSRRMRFIPGPA